ncbi:DUF2071 domain-containing protein [soil metagenome]
MRVPVIKGLIRRRLLLNFRADPDVVQALLPEGLRPKLHHGSAIIGICLIRLEEMRPKGLPSFLGLSSENAAHRMAVEWEDASGQTQEGVYVPRRDTDSSLNALAGGRIFPGEQNLSRFRVDDDEKSVAFSMMAFDGTAIKVEALAGEKLPPVSGFSSLEESSAFFERGCLGYSATCGGTRLDGLRLQTDHWSVRPLAVTQIRSTYFEDINRFPVGSLDFDHGLIMRNIPHEWHSVDDFLVSTEKSANSF